MTAAVEQATWPPTSRYVALDCPFLTPQGHLIYAEAESAEVKAVPEPTGEQLRRAFKKSSAEGLLQLATLRQEAALPPALAYWRTFGERYLTELCHSPEHEGVPVAPPAPPAADLAAMVEAAPPMLGGEYLQTGTLERLWAELDECVREGVAATPGGLSAWLRARSPVWHCVGRVCLHLAENKRDAECPFAFLATYAPGLVDGRRVRYLPLGNALKEYAGAHNKKALVNLLTPVQRAADRCGWMRELVDSGEVFHPLRWTPNEAHRFLQDVPLLEESGVLVRVPDWWRKAPPRVRVNVSVGSVGQAHFTVQSMLDFSVNVALDGEPLTDEEWARILAGGDGLVFLKGRWVEVDRARLASALEHWKEVERAAGGDGISFIEGMRLLAGAPRDADLDGQAMGQCEDWSEVHAGEWLDERLRELREPHRLQTVLPGRDLCATLRPYQETGAKWLWFLSRLGMGACLADDMGLGKTIQVISLLLMLKRERQGGPAAPALLVLPASLLANWKSELERFAPSLAACFLHPSQMKAEDLARAATQPADFLANVDVVLTTYGMATRLEWLSSVGWSLVVLDEAQAIKNAAARQTRAVKQLKADARIALTGTPVENRLSDLWSIFSFLCPGLLGSAKEFASFVKQIEARERDQYAPLRRLVSPYILRRLKTDKTIIADLPEKTEVRAFCGLTKKQAALYQQSVRELAEALDSADGIQRRGIVLSFILRLKQICNHPAQWLGTGAYEPQESGKFRRLGEICEEIAARQGKALVFTQFREMTRPLAAFLQTVFGRPGLVLHGQVAVGKRKGLVDDFQREDGPPFLVLSLKAGGTGLNLTAASHVIHFDRWWNPAVENQATDRAFRIGQKQNVMVHKFVCQGTIEEKIDALIRDKKHLADDILETGVPAMITEMDNAALLNLIRLDMSKVEEE